MLNSVFVLSKLSYDSPRYETVYLDYFDKWLISIRKREGILCQNAWANIYIYIYIYIYISWQTEGFKRSVNSTIEVVIFFLQHSILS